VPLVLIPKPTIQKIIHPTPPNITYFFAKIIENFIKKPFEGNGLISGSPLEEIFVVKNVASNQNSLNNPNVKFEKNLTPFLPLCLMNS
jgi:hypothetical protein